jgi:hypothetical protein
MITAGQLQAPDANRLYIVYVEPGVVVQYGGSASNTNFLGYHSAFAGKGPAGANVDIHYAVIPHPGAPNFTSASGGFASDMNEMTEVTSHELAESVTNPNVNYKLAGWMDTQANEEVADLAVGNYSALNGYLVADVVNQQGALITPFTQQITPPSGLTAPAVTGTALSSTSVQLSWKAVAQVEGYRVFKMSGSQQQLIGTLSSGTLSYKINGLSAGSLTSYVVEAYRGTASADSSVVSVTTPAAVNLPSPTLTASAINSTTAFLSWNAVSGATAYRIFYIKGTGSPQLIGTMSSSSAIGGKFYASISSLVAGSNVKFMIEAYNSSQTGDSAWVGLTLPL